jgi:hypothetical protein
VQAQLPDPQVAQLADAHARAAENLDYHAPAAVAMTDPHAEAAQVKAHRPGRHAEAPRDLTRSIPLVDQTLYLQRSRAQPRVRRGLVRGFVLCAGCLQQRRELVHLKERPAGLWHPHAHPLASRGVALEQFVLDSLIEDRREYLQHTADRRRPERSATAPALVAQLAPGLGRRAQQAGVGDQRCLQAQAARAVDLLDQAVLKRRQQMALEVAAVAGRCARPDLSVCAFGLCLEPMPGVLIKARTGAYSPRAHRRCGAPPDPQPDLREHIAQLAPNSRRIPTTATAAITTLALVKA